jgi:transcriptional regulator with XRE-family HTH domain
MTVREQMRAAYLASGKSQMRIAQESGVHHRTVYKMLKGDNVTVANLFAVACVLNIEAIQVPTRPTS